MARWQKPEPLVPYIDTFGFDLPKSAPLSTSDPWTSSVPSVPWEASSPMAIRESMPSAVSPSLFETTDIEELRETIMREEKEKAAEAYAQKEQELQEKMNALKEQHRLRCDELLRQKEKEIQDILREERLQSQEQIQKATDLWARKGQKLQEELGAKEAEIAALKEEGQFQLEKLLSQQQEQEERLQIQEKAAEARATEKKLQEQLIEKDVLIDALKEENRTQGRGPRACYRQKTLSSLLLRYCLLEVRNFKGEALSLTPRRHRVPMTGPPLHGLDAVRSFKEAHEAAQRSPRREHLEVLEAVMAIELLQRWPRFKDAV